MVTKERGEAAASSPLLLLRPIHLKGQKGLRKQLSDDKSFTEQKTELKREREKERFGGSNEIGSEQQHAIWGRGKKERGRSMSGGN